MTVMTSNKLEAKDALLKALAGCSGCSYDEAEGFLVDHCNRCCRKVTAAAWMWATADGRLRAIQTPKEGERPRPPLPGGG